MEQIKPGWIDVVAHQPSFITIKKSRVHQKGAFAKKKICKGTFLGHYLGEIVNISTTGPYVFHSKKQQQPFAIDASQISKSNWTRYMNCSLNSSEENVKSYYLTNPEIYTINQQPKSLEGYIVFYANRDINKGEELMYYYGDQYVSKLQN